MSKTGHRPYDIREQTNLDGKRYYTVIRDDQIVLITQNLREVHHYQEINNAGRAQGPVSNTTENDDATKRN